MDPEHSQIRTLLIDTLRQAPTADLNTSTWRGAVIVAHAMLDAGWRLPPEGVDPGDRSTAHTNLVETLRAVDQVRADLAAFDIDEDEVPRGIDVLEDYESGLHEAARRLRDVLPPSLPSSGSDMGDVR